MQSSGELTLISRFLLQECLVGYQTPNTPEIALWITIKNRFDGNNGVLMMHHREFCSRGWLQYRRRSELLTVRCYRALFGVNLIPEGRDIGPRNEFLAQEVVLSKWAVNFTVSITIERTRRQAWQIVDRWHLKWGVGYIPIEVKPRERSWCTQKFSGTDWRV